MRGCISVCELRGTSIPGRFRRNPPGWEVGEMCGRQRPRQPRDCATEPNDATSNSQTLKQRDAPIRSDTQRLHLEEEQRLSRKRLVNRSSLVEIVIARTTNFLGANFSELAKCLISWSEWQDLNLRPPRPERGALPG